MAIFSLKKFISILFVGGIFILDLSITSFAMQSQQYQLEPQEITNEFVNSSEPPPSQVTLNSDQLQELDHKGFVVTTDNTASFLLTTSVSDLSFGELSPATEAVVSTKIKIIGDDGYQIMISSIRPLTSLSGSVLKNTTCDKGCTYLHATPWVNGNIYGLGYTLNGQNRAEDFINKTYFRALPDLSHNQPPTVISKTTSMLSNNTLEILFKLLPSSVDTESYSTVINLDAIPTY